MGTTRAWEPARRVWIFLLLFRVMFLLVTMLPSVAVPSFGAKGESPPGYAMEVDLRSKVTNMEAGERASAPVLQMESTARDVRMAMGNDKLAAPETVGRVIHAPHDYFKPDATDAVYHDVVKLLDFGQTTQSTADNSAKFDLLRRRAEARTHLGGPESAAFASVLRLQNASLCRAGKSPSLASVRGSLEIIEVAQLGRRKFGQMGDSGRQDAPYVAEDNNAKPSSSED